MKENDKINTINVVRNESPNIGDEYTIVVSIQGPEQFGMLLPTAIDIAKKHDGKVILLNVIEIPYQLPPSAAKKFILERKLFLRKGIEMLKRADCKGISAIRIAHDINNAIEQFTKNKNANIIIREDELVAQPDTIFDRFKNSLKSWF